MQEFKKHNHRDIELYKDVSGEEWNDWKWQLRNVVRDIPTLKKIMPVDEALEKDLESCLEKFTMAITPYYASIMEKDYDRGVIRLQAVPRKEELNVASDDLNDPLHEDVDSPVPGSCV